MVLGLSVVMSLVSVRVRARQRWQQWRPWDRSQQLNIDSDTGHHFTSPHLTEASSWLVLVLARGGTLTTDSRQPRGLSCSALPPPPEQHKQRPHVSRRGPQRPTITLMSQFMRPHDTELGGAQ